MSEKSMNEIVMERVIKGEMMLFLIGQFLHKRGLRGEFDEFMAENTLDWMPKQNQNESDGGKR
jgi:hypothetical protein